MASFVAHTAIVRNTARAEGQQMDTRTLGMVGTARFSRRSFVVGLAGAAGVAALRSVHITAAPASLSATIATGTPRANVSLSVQVATLSDYQGAVKGLAWSPDSSHLASFDDGDDHAIYLSTADGATTLTLAGHTGLPHSVAFSPDETLLATGALSDDARIWGADGTPRASLDSRHTEAVLAGAVGQGVGNTPRASVESQGIVLWSPTGTMLATDAGLGGEIVKLWDPTGKALASLPPKPENAVTATSFVFSPDSAAVAVGTSAFDVRVYRIDGSLLRKLTGFKDFVSAVAYSPDGQLLAAGSFDHTVRLYRADGSTIATLPHGAPISVLAWSPDGQALATSADGVALFKPDGTQIAKLGSETDLPAWSPDSAGLAVADGDTVQLRSPDGGLTATLEGHTSTVLVLAWSPDGKALASGSRDGTVRLWR